VAETFVLPQPSLLHLLHFDYSNGAVVQRNLTIKLIDQLLSAGCVADAEHFENRIVEFAAVLLLLLQRQSSSVLTLKFVDKIGQRWRGSRQQFWSK